MNKPIQGHKSNQNMDIKVNTVHFTADKKLVDHINKKVGKLGQFFDRIIGAEVFLRLENVHDDENKIAEVKLLIPGDDLFVKKQAKTFEEAINKAVDSLNRQVSKYKEKLRGWEAKGENPAPSDENDL